jgi:hypothetical protein
VVLDVRPGERDPRGHPQAEYLGLESIAVHGASLQRQASILNGMRAAIIILALLLFGTTPGCSGKGESTIPPDESAEEEEVSEEGKSWGGWRWKGKRDDCFFVHGNQCFDQLAAACKAAGCGEDSCTHDKAAPANVSCK